MKVRQGNQQFSEKESLCCIDVALREFNIFIVAWFDGWLITKGTLGYLSSMYFSASLVLGEVAGPFPEIES